MDSKDKVSLVYHFEDDDNAREAKQIEENVITEEHDEGDTETEVQLDSIFCDDEQPDENQDSAFSPQFHELDKMKVNQLQNKRQLNFQQELFIDW
eukprot:gene8030-8889_t